MNKITSVVFDECDEIKVVYGGLWQYDYGQILRIEGLDLPSAVEIHFSLEETGGEAKRRIGITQSGVTDVVIPDFILEGNDATRNYDAYAFIYLSDEESGETTHKIKMQIKSRSKPEGSTGSDETSFGAIMDAVNKIAEQNGQGVSDEKIAEAVNAYMEANPVEGNVTVDTELSETSTNPVQNKVVAAKFSQLSDTINEVKKDMENVGNPTDEQVASAVNSYLEEHLEVTTTVQDGSITKEKLSEDIKTLVESLTEEVIVSTDYVFATSISLNKSSANGQSGETVQLVASVLPSNATEKTVKWSSSDNSIARVDDNGLVTFIKNGTATITATSFDDESIKANCVITISAKTVTVYLYQIEPYIENKNISKVGAETNLGGHYKVYSVEYKDGMVVDTCVNSAWVSSYPPVVIKHSDGTYEGIEGEFVKTIADSQEHRNVLLSGYPSVDTVYINTAYMPGGTDEKYKYTYSE